MRSSKIAYIRKIVIQCVHIISPFYTKYGSRKHIQLRIVKYFSTFLTHAPSLTDLYRFSRILFRVFLFGINILILALAILRASGKSILSGNLMLRKTFNMLPKLLSVGEDVTGEISTMMALSTRCGYI